MEQKLTVHKNDKSRSHQPALSPFWNFPADFSSLWNPASLWNPVRFEPLWWNNDMFDAARKNMNLAFENWFARGLQPYADITGDQKTLRIKMDVPGLEADDIDISADGGMLTISADKQEKQDGTESRYSFSYSTLLPEDANIEQADINLANNRLSIEIPRKSGDMKRGGDARHAISKTKHAKHKLEKHEVQSIESEPHE
jgi:HSP20 family molecular chaperone IbpA